jgi:hypothetical protein
MNEMKMQAHDHEIEPGRVQLGTVLASLAACLFAALPALASGGAGNGDSGDDADSGSTNPAVSGDETIGTLPAIGGGRINLPFTRTWRGIQPAFYLEGSAADLTIAIESARGRGFVSCEVLDPDTGRLRLAFHGDVIVTLDRELAASLPIDVGVAVPTSFGEARIRYARAGAPTRVAPLLPGLLSLPVASMLTTNALDQSPIRIRTVNAAGLRTAHTVAATTDLLVLRQME